jgi:hypothetical protein
MGDYVRPNIDLELLDAERKGLVPPPSHRHGRNIDSNYNSNNIDRTENVPSLEEHWHKKGFTNHAIKEKFRELSKHED